MYLIYLFPGCGLLDAADRGPPGRGPTAHFRGGVSENDPGSCGQSPSIPLTCSLTSRPEAHYCAAPAGTVLSLLFLMVKQKTQEKDKESNKQEDLESSGSVKLTEQGF